MFAQYLASEYDEYDTSEGFDRELELATDEAADEAAGKGHGKGGDTDGYEGVGDGGKALHADAGERDAYGQRVDADTYGEHEHGSQAGGVEVVLLVVAYAVTYHLHAEEDEDGEGYPVIVALDEVVEMYRTQPAQQGHERLEESEKEGYGEEVSPADGLEQESGSDGHGKTVHSQGKGGEPYLERGHGRFLLKLR